MKVDAQALPYAVDLKIQLKKSGKKKLRREIIKVYRATGEGRYYHYFDVRSPASDLTLIDSVSSEDVYSYRIRYSARINKSRQPVQAKGSAAVFYSPPEDSGENPGGNDHQPPPPIQLGANESRCPAEFSAEVLALVNVAREQNGLPALQADAQLDWAAESHNDWMIRNNRFEHTGWYESILASGFQGVSFGQNIARYIPTPAGVVEGWLGSPGHRANILKSSFNHMGLSCLIGPSGETWWTQDFGS